MSTLPAATDFIGADVTEGGFKAAITGLRGYLSALFGDDGTANTACATLGILSPNEMQALSAAADADRIAAENAAAQSAASRDLAIAAWAASMAPAETLPAISKSLHSGAIVKAIIYDTSKDSDGGAWRKRCQDKSWYTEALGFTGAWRNQLASTSAAWAVPGAAAGDGFQNTTDGKYYVLTGTSTASEIFRGNVREFPEQVAIVAETARVVIYDLTQVGTPMWMAFTISNAFPYNMLAVTGSGSIAAKNGSFVFATAAAWSALHRVDFVSDNGRRYREQYGDNGSDGYYRGGIANRNAAATFDNSRALGNIVNYIINDIAITVLDNAPIDTATGLPVPTIAVATNGGVSVIKDSGTVINGANTSAVSSLFFLPGAPTTLISKALSGTHTWRSVDYTGASFPMVLTYISPNSGSTIPAILDWSTIVGRAASGSLGVFGSTGLSMIKEYPATPVKSMVAYITNAYNSGWMVGDIRGAWLANTVAETLTASGELVTNGTFDTNVNGYTITGGTATWVAAGESRLNASGAGAEVKQIQAIPTVVGKAYSVHFDAYASAGSALYSAIGTYAGGVDVTGWAVNNQTPATKTRFSYSFIAVGTVSYLFVMGYQAGVAEVFVDNISVKLADPDRSVKNNGLIINGSITKSAVASGANLMAYSGFSAANYLEQPYSANLDFGTGDFCVMGWVNTATGTGAHTIFDRRESPVGTNGLLFDISSGAAAVALGHLGAGQAYLNSNQPLALNAWNFVAATRVSGVVSIYTNGIAGGSTLNDSRSLTSATATSRVGLRVDNNSIFNGLIALLRISATAPSAEQIRHIYETEKALFQANAKCTIDGTSTAVTALAHDEATDLLHVGTSWGRTSFNGLVRVDSEATTTGALTSLSASQGAILTGGTSAKYYQPAMLLRDELRRKDEARKALGKTPVFFEFDAVTSQVAFVLPKGYTAKAVYSAGTLKRVGSTKDYTVSYDGFAETVTFAVAPGNGVWISVMGVRA